MNNLVYTTKSFDEPCIKFYLDSYIGLLSDLIQSMKIFPILI